MSVSYILSTKTRVTMIALSFFDATVYLNRTPVYEALACMRSYDNGSQNQKQETYLEQSINEHQ